MMKQTRIIRISFFDLYDLHGGCILERLLFW